MLAWTQQNTMQRAMWTVLEWPQSHAISKTINMLTNKSEPQQVALIVALRVVVQMIVYVTEIVAPIN